MGTHHGIDHKLDVRSQYIAAQSCLFDCAFQIGRNPDFYGLEAGRKIAAHFLDDGLARLLKPTGRIKL